MPAGAAAVPLIFARNFSESHRSAGFLAKGPSVSAYFSPTEISLQLADAHMRIEFLGSKGARVVEPSGMLSGVANFLIGAETSWKTGVELLQGVAYRDIYPGIDVIFRANGAQLKWDYVIKPGADPAHIRVRYVGTRRMGIEDDGSLMIDLGHRRMRESAPVLYQERSGTMLPVSGRFSLKDHVVSFVVGDYDKTLELTIDPALSYMTLLGGSAGDAALSIAVDGSGAAYAAGFTASADLPVTNAAQFSSTGGNEAFVVKLAPDGKSVVYCSYIGGRGDTRAYAVAVDATGAAYVAGSTTSENFPVLGGFQRRLAGGRNGFALKIAPAGNSLVYSTFLGGTGSDAAYGIAVDASGVAYVTGDTTSGSTFPSSGTIGPRGGSDVFVAKVATDGAKLLYSTILGGRGEDHANAIAVSANGTAAITGSTYSTDYPLLNAQQKTLGGGQDVFVTEVSADGKGLVFSTYLGGSGGTVGAPEAGHSLAIDSVGDIYVAGETSSVNFPVRTPAQASSAGWQDAFIAKFRPDGTLTYSTYLGGPGRDSANALAIDRGGAVYVVGETTSSVFASILKPQNAGPGVSDVYVAKLSAAGDQIEGVAYFGGIGAETATSVALDTMSNLYIAGWTLSPDFAVVNGIQSVNGGNYSAFAGKMSFSAPGLAVSVSPLTAAMVPSQSQQFTATVLNAPNTAVTWSVSPAVGTITPTGLYTAPSSPTAQTLTVTATSVADPTKSATSTITIGSSASTNLALGRIATESSIVAPASRAVDGSTDGNYFNGSVSHTGADPNAWWQVDLGASYTITAVQLWNRTECCGARLSDYWVFVSNTPFADGDTPATLQTRAGTSAIHQTSAPSPSATVAPMSPGRYVRVQLAGTNNLHLAEVQVYGTGVGVIMSPGAASLAAGGTQQFTASVINTANTAVIWSVSPNIGTVANGLYTAPPIVSTAQTVSVIAASAADPSKTATAAIALQVTGGPINLARGKLASQSSTSAGTANVVVDGNTDGQYFNGSVSQTNSEANAWWQVDLGASATISAVTIWNRTDCCASRLGDYWIFISDTPFAATDTPASLQLRTGTWRSHQTVVPNPSSTVPLVAHGRYVRIQLNGTDVLNLAEVQVTGVWCSTDLALGKPASQSSDWAPASRAVDGNIDGVYFDGSVSQTGPDTNAWWQVDLGASAVIGSVAVWNRTDCCGSRLGDYWVFISDTPFGPSDTPQTLQGRAGTWSTHQTTAPGPGSLIAAGVQGRYVRIQLNGTNNLHMAEVEVFGAAR